MLWRFLTTGVKSIGWCEFSCYIWNRTQEYCFIIRSTICEDVGGEGGRSHRYLLFSQTSSNWTWWAQPRMYLRSWTCSARSALWCGATVLQARYHGSPPPLPHQSDQWLLCNHRDSISSPTLLPSPACSESTSHWRVLQSRHRVRVYGLEEGGGG